MEEVVGASLSEMIRGTKTCDKGAHCYAPQPITADLIGRGGGLCGTHIKQTNDGAADQEDAWWIFEQISGPGLDEQQAILSLMLNSQHRALMTSADLGQQVRNLLLATCYLLLATCYLLLAACSLQLAACNS